MIARQRDVWEGVVGKRGVALPLAWQTRLPCVSPHSNEARSGTTLFVPYKARGSYSKSPV